MGMLMLSRCPNSGRLVLTGMEVDDYAFKYLSDYLGDFRCECGGRHPLRKNRVVLTTRDRWHHDPKIENCYIKAIELAEKAESALTNEQRQFFLSLEAQWLTIAKEHSARGSPRDAFPGFRPDG